MEPAGQIAAEAPLQAEADVLRRLHAEITTGLDALLPALLDRGFEERSLKPPR